MVWTSENIIAIVIAFISLIGTAIAYLRFRSDDRFALLEAYRIDNKELRDEMEKLELRVGRHHEKVMRLELEMLQARQRIDILEEENRALTNENNELRTFIKEMREKYNLTNGHSQIDIC